MGVENGAARMIEFFSQVWQALWAALTFDVAALAPLVRAQADVWQATLVILTVALLAGISVLLGDSVTLFANHVKPARFFLTLVVNGILFALELFVWAVTIWLCAILFYGKQDSLLEVFLVVCLGSAPLVFGFLILVPYFGEGIRWFLRVYSWLVTLVLVAVQYQFSIGPAIVCSVGGWLLIQVFSVLFARPLDAVQDWVWRNATGTSGVVTFDRQIQFLTQQLRQNARTDAKP